MHTHQEGVQTTPPAQSLGITTTVSTGTKRAMKWFPILDGVSYQHIRTLPKNGMTFTCNKVKGCNAMFKLHYWPSSDHTFKIESNHTCGAIFPERANILMLFEGLLSGSIRKYNSQCRAHVVAGYCEFLLEHKQHHTPTSPIPSTLLEHQDDTTIIDANNQVDERSQWIIHSPPNHIRAKFIEDVGAVISSKYKNKLWTPLVGGGGKRWYAKDMCIDASSIYDTVHKASSWYVKTINNYHPKLTHQVMSCLLSGPKAKSQDYLHVDYNLQTWNRKPDEQPISVLIAIEPFSLEIVCAEDKEELELVTVNPGCMIVFINKCIHRGGANTINKYARRVFFYCTHQREDIETQVPLWVWDETTKKYIPKKDPKENNPVTRKRKK
jgi:hypothetical protein